MQIWFYLLDKERIMKIAEVIAGEGFELIQPVYPHHQQMYYQSVPTNSRMLFEMATNPAGIFRFRRPEYGEYNRAGDPAIEWSQAGVVKNQKAVQQSRIYLCTWNFDKYGEETVELLKKDYKLLRSVVSKLVPMTTVTINGKSMRLRADEMTIEYLKMGYIWT